VNYGRTISTHARNFLGGLSLLAVVCAHAQAPQPAQPRTVPLVSDTCPSVRIGDRVSLDWNPLFDPEWPVAGLHAFVLRFARMTEDGAVDSKQEQLRLGAQQPPASISPLGNGYFHVEFTVFMKPIRHGTYRLVRADAAAEVDPDYANQAPQMTRSPVDERYCFTVVGPATSQSPQP
jgi:hypothetical protein